VVAPQVPLRCLVGQAVLDDEADGQFLDAARVLAPGVGQVSQVGGEEEVAVGAVMPGERDDEVDGAAGARVAEVVQGARGGGVAAGTGAAARTAASFVVAAALFETRLGELLDAGDALGGIGNIFAGSRHGGDLHTQMPPYLHFTPAGPHSAHWSCYSVPGVILFLW
jgi:hypothetical protein